MEYACFIPVIVEVLRTVHQLLLGHEMSLLSCGVDEETSFYIARSRESPARSTLALVLDAAHCAKFAPVEKFWRCSRQFFLSLGEWNARLVSLVILKIFNAFDTVLWDEIGSIDIRRWTILSGLHQIEVLKLVPGHVREFINVGVPSQILRVYPVDFFEVFGKNGEALVHHRLIFVRLFESAIHCSNRWYWPTRLTADSTDTDKMKIDNFAIFECGENAGKQAFYIYPECYKHLISI